MKKCKCAECNKIKWTRRHDQERWTCQRCIRKIQAGRRIKRQNVHAVN